jgi:outer membrane biosynthesis protein TonB
VQPYLRPIAGGKVTVGFVTRPNGLVQDPVVLQSTNRRLDLLMREAVARWVCEPARLNGTPVHSIRQATLLIKFGQRIQISE